eukprot:2739343-Ditylum_brightwellii.AAC.1
MCINALTTTSNTRHVIGNKDSTKHELLLCSTRHPTVNSGNKTSAAHPYLYNCSNACSGVSATDVLLPRTVSNIKQEHNSRTSNAHQYSDNIKQTMYLP